MRFDELQLNDALQRAIQDEGYTEPTPIQAQAIPHVLAGRDLIGLAQTGTGKTAAFALPILHHLHEANANRHPKAKRHIQALVLAPTRELASQIGESVKAYGRYTSLKHLTIYGGVNIRPQIEQLKAGVHILIATPGRLLDLMNQGMVRFDRLQTLILDEADRMLDMGFLPDIKRIIKQLPTERQTLLFSATMPPDIQQLAGGILLDPVTVEVAPESTTVEAIEQRVFFVEKHDKRKLLQHLLHEHNMHRTLVFTRTKRGANQLMEHLEKVKIPAEAIHGNKSQNARERALSNFKRGKTQVLVATDIAARGIDVDNISHVVNFDLPNDTESYVHRIGRTGRAGAEGMALSFCAADERDYLVAIERLIQMHIPVAADHPYPSDQGLPQPTQLNGKRRSAKPNHAKAKTSGQKNKAHAGASKGNGGTGANGNSQQRRNKGNGQRSSANGHNNGANGQQRNPNQQPKRREPRPQA